MDDATRAELGELTARLRDLRDATTDPTSRDALSHVVWLLTHAAHPVHGEEGDQ